MQIAGKACSDSTAPQGRGPTPLAVVSSHATHAQAPVGASSARIIVTLLAALRRYDLKRGMVGVGKATAIAIERL